MEARIYITTDSRLSRESVKWYGYVLECIQEGCPRTKEGFGTVTGTYHKATLAALADALQRFLCPCEICVCTEDSFVLNMLGRNLAAWAGNGFLAGRGEACGKQSGVGADMGGIPEAPPVCRARAPCLWGMDSG